MSCPAEKCLCKRLVITQSITYNSGVLTINIPSGTYENCEKYFLILAQNIPAETIVNATVVVTIGSSPTTYPLLNCNCTNVSPAQLTTRTRYSTRVYTNIQSGVFKLLGPTKCNYCREYTGSLPITT